MEVFEHTPDTHRVGVRARTERAVHMDLKRIRPEVKGGIEQVKPTVGTATQCRAQRTHVVGLDGADELRRRTRRKTHVLTAIN